MRWENTSLSLGAPRFQNIFLSQLRKRRSKPHIFLKRKSKAHFEKGTKYFWTGPEYFTFSCIIWCVFYTTTKQKQVQGKVIYPLKTSVCDVPPNHKIQAGFEKENTPQTIFSMAAFGGVSIYFVGRCLPCPECNAAHSLCSSSSGQPFVVRLSSQRSRLFYAGALYQGHFACMHKHKKYKSEYCQVKAGNFHVN